MRKLRGQRRRGPGRRRLAGDSGGGSLAPKRHPDDGGATTVESVILFPIMLLLIMIAVQMAVFFHARGVATAAARAGLDAARVEEGSATVAQETAQEFLTATGGGLTVTAINVTRPAPAEPGDRADVTVEGDVLTVFPRFLVAPSVSITVDAPIEVIDE